MTAVPASVVKGAFTVGGSYSRDSDLVQLLRISE